MNVSSRGDSRRDLPSAVPIDFLHEPVDGLVSVVIPTFNRERYLGESIDTVLSQTYPHIELIVVDDGSTDGTRDLLAGYGAAVHVLTQPNQGPSVARNAGMAASRGEYLALLDSDDVWEPQKLERQIARFDAVRDLEVSGCEMQSFWIDELAEEQARLSEHIAHRRQAAYSPSTLVLRRSVIDRVGGFDPSLRVHEDTDWNVRMMSLGTVREVLPELLVRRRVHRANLTRTSDAGMHQVLRLLRKNLKR